MKQETVDNELRDAANYAILCGKTVSLIAQYNPKELGLYIRYALIELEQAGFDPETLMRSYAAFAGYQALWDAKPLTDTRH